MINIYLICEDIIDSIYQTLKKNSTEILKPDYKVIQDTDLPILTYIEKVTEFI